MRAEIQSPMAPLAGLLALCALGAALLLALLSPSARATPCANEAIRAEQGPAALALPDCRAYEFVTPGSTPFTNSTNEEVEGARASVTGSGLAYYTRYPATEAVRSGFRYLAKRGSSGWSVEDVAPQDSPTSSISLNCEQAVDFSPDLSEHVLSDGWNLAEEGKSGHCSESEEVLVPGAPLGYGNLYLQAGSGAPYSLINLTPELMDLTPEGSLPANALLEDYTPDFSRILFAEAATLYEWSEGALHLIPFLPNGEPVSGTIANSVSLPGGASKPDFGLAAATNAMSPDGENVFFNANGNLYLRRNATQAPTASGACSQEEPNKACTVEIDRQQGGSGESGGGTFWYASADGSRVFFSDERKLTGGGSQAAPGRPDLYEYEVATGFLRDRSHTETLESPNARGFSGAGENAAYLYFVARGVLSGSGTNSEGEKAQPSAPNLYLLSEKGAVSFIATLDGERDSLIWQELPSRIEMGKMTTAVSPNGRYLAFATAVKLTEFNNAPASPEDCAENACKELFLFDAQSKQLTCISCDSAGAPPTGETKLPGPTSFSGKAIGRLGYFARQVFDDGRVFFTTPDALVPADVNGEPDLYQYFNGELSLISSGSMAGASEFLDASPSGSDVFFTTPENLVGSDTDNGNSVYDARVGGGIPELPAPPPPCERESCRGAASPPEGVTAPGSVGFAGPQEGPAHPQHVRCRRGFVERQGKCQKVHHKKRKHHRRSAK